MRVAYTLTWEEYAEQFEASSPRPNIFAVIVTTIVAVPLLAYGIALRWFALTDDKAISWVFICSPLLLVGSVVVSVRSELGQKRKQAVAKERLEYERWYAGEQSFSFDQEKWVLETIAGKQESPWSALLTAVELKNTLHMFAEKSSVQLPKRVLDGDTLIALRRMALPVPRKGFVIQTHCWDHQSVETALLWRKRRFAMAFGNIFGLVVLGWVAQLWLASEQKVVLMWGWILASAAVILTLTAQLWYLPLYYVTSEKRWRMPKKMEFSDRGIQFASAWSNYFIAWKVCVKFKELGRAFLIYTSERRYYNLPKRYLTPEQQDELRRVLQENVRPDGAPATHATASSI